MPFVDTNILLYAISTQPEEAEKSQKAKAILIDIKQRYQTSY